MSRFPFRVAVCGCLLSAMILPTFAVNGTVQADGGLRLRSGSSTSSSIITTMANGSSIEILEDMGNGWYQVSYGDHVGYSSASYITLLEEIVQESSSDSSSQEETTSDTLYIQVTSGPLNIRSGAGTSYDKVGSLSVGTVVETTGLQGSWYQIADGYVYADYVKEIDYEAYQSSTDLGQQIADYAVQFVGCKYVYGGTTPSGFDCSGFVQYVFKNFGITINRTASAQLSNGTAISISELQPGDAVYFKSTGSSTAASHCGIYIGNGQFVHASTSGVGVIISDLDYAYYTTGFVGGRRMA